MFGYVKPLVAELKVGEYQYYRAAYCGICRAMGDECGCTSRLFLSYDFTFLALLLSAVNGEKTSITEARCPVNPLAKRKIVTDSEFITYSAAAGGILAAYRFHDDRQDEKGARVVAATVGYEISKGWLKKASAKYPGLCDGIKSRLDALDRMEKDVASQEDGFISIDELAGLFGDILAYICAYPFLNAEAPEEKQRKIILETVGRHIGRWIYCIDALDDLKQDEKRGRFNPFLKAYGSALLGEDDRTALKIQLEGIAGEASMAFDLCENFEDYTHEPKQIVENILELGLSDVADKVIRGIYKKPGKDRI